jgi:tetratricopeptide (TPR) repeat protein
VAHVVSRLALWASRPGQGLGRVEFVSEDSRRRVVQQLRSRLQDAGIALQEIEFPRDGRSPTELVRWLLERLESLPEGVLSVSELAAALPQEAQKQAEALYPFTFNRENLARPPRRQIWWMPPHFAETFIKAVPDLDSWFTLKLRLAEVVASGSMTLSTAFSAEARVRPGTESMASPETARQRSQELLERFQRALAQAGTVEELPFRLAEQAVEALREAGLDPEADELSVRLNRELAEVRHRLPSPEEGPDFFVSYAGADARWAEWIAWQLEAAGGKTRVQAWDFRPGSNFVLEMHRAASECRRTLAVLSPAFLKSVFTQPEWAAAFAQDPTGEKGKLVPVRVAACDLPGLLKSIIHIDLVGLDEEAARQEILKGLERGRAKPGAAPAFPGAKAPVAAPSRGAPAYPGALPAVWTLPFPRNPHFTGREKLLEALRRQLAEKTVAAISQPQAVHGLGGVGKTQLAVQYAWEHHAEYEAVLWVVADSPGNASANLASLSRPEGLDLPEAAAKEQDARLAAVLRWLRQNPRWLLIFDSVDSPEASEFVRRLLDPAWPGHTIVTSRRTDWPASMKELPVDALPNKEAARFLCERVGQPGYDPGGRDDAARVAKELGGLPLAMEQAAAYVLRHRITFADYLSKMRKSRPELLGFKAEGATRYQKSVATTWLVTEDRLSVAARAILRLAAFLAPDDVPRDLFGTGAKALQEAIEALEAERKRKRTDTQGPHDPESALVELADYTLITLRPKAFSCHRLVQAVQADRLDSGERRRWTELALRLVDDFASGDPSDVRTWPVWEPLRPHAETVARHGDELAIPEPTARLMSQLGQFLCAKALYREAEPLMRRGLAVGEKSLGQDHPKVAIRLNNLAALLQATNRLSEAEPLMRRALAIDEASFGPDHPEVATDLNNLAQLLKATNRLSEAEPLMRRVVEIFEKTLGEDHPNVATCLNNLALLLQDTNRLSEAEPLMRRALAIDEKSFGPGHPDVARDLNNLVQLLQATNRQSEAEPLMRRALAIDEASLGPDHPYVAIRLNNLAALLQATNRQSEAEPLMRRALAIDEASFGPDHPEVATDLNNLAQLLQDTDRLLEAEPLMRRALVILRKFRESTGHEHPHFQAAIGNYTGLLLAMKLPEEEVKRRVQEAAGCGSVGGWGCGT